MDRKQVNFLLFLIGVLLLSTVILALLSSREPAGPQPLPEVPTPRLSQTSTLMEPQATQPTIETVTTPSETAAPAIPTATQSPTTAASLTITATPTVQVLGSEFFVSPEGSPENDGSRQSPWPLQYVLDHPEPIHPGDTIWVMGGRYTGPFESRLVGEDGKPITVRAVPGERAILESSTVVLDVINTRHVVFWGLELTALPFERDPQADYEGAYGVRIHQGSSDDSHNVKFINLVIHDIAAQGFGWWFTDKNSELYGSLIFFNGVTQLDHGVYLNNQHGEKRLIDNMIFDNASHGIHAYGEKDYQQLNNLYLEGNTVFNNGSIGYSTRLKTWGIYKRNILLGGYNVAENPVVVENYTYFPGLIGESFNLGYRAGSVNAVVENNYFAGGQLRLGGANDGITMLSNTILGFALPELLKGGNNFLLYRPSENRIFVRPNQYEPGRANITIYNWARQATVTLTAADLQGVEIQKGDRYQLRNVQDYFTDIISGVYDGVAIEIPMTNHTVAQPMGLSFKPHSTFPEFGAFVLLPEPAPSQE